MRKLLATFFIAITLFIISGCTAKLASRSVENKKVAKGLVYQLPATRIDISVTHELVKCGDNPEIRIVGATYTSHLVPDDRPEATFALDTDALQSGTKTIPEAKIILQNNILTSVNYKAEDKTGEIVGKLAEITALSKGISLPKLQPETNALSFTTSDIPDACSVMARNALYDKQKLENMIDATRSDMEAIFDQIQKGYVASDNNALTHKNHIDALRAAYHKSVLRLTNDGLDDNSRVALAKTVASLKDYLATEVNAFNSYEAAWREGREAALVASEKKLSHLISEHTVAKAALTANATIQWLPMPDQSSKNNIYLYNVTELYKWFDTLGAAQLTTTLTEWKNANGIKISTDCVPSGATNFDAGLQTAVYYRVPKRCDIDVAKCLNTECSNTVDTITLPNVPIAQYGYTASLPVSNGPFENSDYAVDFDLDTGRLKTFTFKSDKAALLEATKSIAKAQDLLKETDIEKMDAKQAELDKETELINAETKLIDAKEKKLEAQKKLDAANKEAENNKKPSESTDGGT